MTGQGGEHGGGHSTEKDAPLTGRERPTFNQERADEFIARTYARPTLDSAEALSRLGEAVKDLCWRAVQYGETEDGDTAYYLVTKGTMHRLIGVAQGVGISASFREPTHILPPEGGAP